MPNISSSEQTSTISIIVATDDKRGIGRNNHLMWNIPEDMKRFRNLTSDHPIIMGRKTYESIGRPLPKRTNIVVTRDSNKKLDGCIVVNSLENAIAIAKQNIGSEEIFIIGGAEIYKQAISLAGKLYITIVNGDYKADAFFPEYKEFTKVLSKEEGKFGKYTYQFFELRRDRC